MLAFTDTPGLFGGELHLLGAIDAVDGRIVRWMDYWDSSDFDRALIARIRTSETDYPDVRATLVPVTADAAMVTAAGELRTALAAGDANQVRPLLSFDCVWEDMALRAHRRGHGDRLLFGKVASQPAVRCRRHAASRGSRTELWRLRVDGRNP